MINKIFMPARRRIELLDTQTLCLIPIILGLAVGALVYFFYRPEFTGNIAGILIYFLIFFLWGIPGMIIVIRKEAPFFIPFERTGPIVLGYGLFMMFAWWSLALVMLLIYLAGILHRLL
jgi:hypothetical protein